MAEKTPESDAGSIECFQNYTAPEVFIQGLAGIVNQQDVESMIRAQKQMLQRFEKTNEMLTNCNALSVNRLKSAGMEFKKHTQLLCEVRKDLDNVYKRVRVLKMKLSSSYPEAFTDPVQQKIKMAAEEKEKNDGGQSRPKSCIEPQVVDLFNSQAQRSGSCKNLSRSKEDGDETAEIPSSLKRNNSSSTDSANGNSNNDTSPCTSDSG